jgi:hypothetical protein
MLRSPLCSSIILCSIQKNSQLLESTCLPNTFSTHHSLQHTICLNANNSTKPIRRCYVSVCMIDSIPSSVLYDMRVYAPFGSVFVSNLIYSLFHHMPPAHVTLFSAMLGESGIAEEMATQNIQYYETRTVSITATMSML